MRRIAGHGDFDALFAQLDSPDSSAPINGGLSRLVYTMEAFKRAQAPLR